MRFKKSMMLLSILLLLTGWTNSWADAPLSTLLRENPTAAQEMTQLRLIWAGKIAVADSGRVRAEARNEALSDDLWECIITKPAERGALDSFEVGMAMGSALAAFLVWALRVILE